MKRKVSFDELVDFLRPLPDDVKLELAENPVEAREALEGWMVERVKNLFVVHADDKDALPHNTEVVAHYRERNDKGTDYGQSPILWKVKTGFNFRLHAPLTKVPLYGDWKYLQDWQLANEEDTKEGQVLWTPRLVEGSKSKTPSKMMDILDAEYKKWKLPKLDRTKPFGSVSLLTALIAAHYKRTSGRERVPLNRDYAATDTLDSAGDRLVLGRFDERGLSCDYWGGAAFVGVACFPTVVLPSAA